MSSANYTKDDSKETAQDLPALKSQWKELFKHSSHSDTFRKPRQVPVKSSTIRFPRRKNMEGPSTSSKSMMLYRMGSITVSEDLDSRDSGISMDSQDGISCELERSGGSLVINSPTDFSDMIMEEDVETTTFTSVCSFSLQYKSRSPATQLEGQTECVLASKTSGTFSLLNTESDNSDYLTGSDENKESCQRRTPRCAFRLKDITNTSYCEDSSPKSRKTANIGVKLGRKRSSNLLKTLDSPKRRRNAKLFDHDENDIPIPARSIPRVHSSSVLEMSMSQYAENGYGSPECLEHYSLITVEKPQIPSTAFRSISGDTLSELLSSMTEERFRRKFHLVDCRYSYEYKGGHIQHSVNIDVDDLKAIEKMFYPEDEQEFDEINSKIPIFYCEFSQKRGPAMASKLRTLDRERNPRRWPHLDYKEIYVLNHGYKRFFSDLRFAQFCEPRNYVSMTDPAYREELKRYRFHRVRSAVHAASECRVVMQKCVFDRREISIARRTQSSTCRTMSSSELISYAVDINSSVCSPISSTSASTQQQQQIPIQQRFSKMSMQSPSSPASYTAGCLGLGGSSRRKLFASICEESSPASCSSSSRSSSTHSSPTLSKAKL